MWTPPPKPWAHQIEGKKRALEEGNFGFFWEMGCGKSRATIDTLVEMYKWQMRKTIIFCPPLVIDNWVKEWKKYGNLNAIPLIGTAAKRVKLFRANMGPARRIFVTNYEALSMQALFDAFQEWKAEVLVWDESQKLKSIKAARSKKADELSNPFDTKTKKWGEKPTTFLLSGTPALNSPMDMFQQFVVLDNGQTFGRNFWAFRAKFFRDRNAAMPKERYFPKWELMNLKQDGFDAETEIRKLMSKKIMRVEKENCLDLPEEISVTINVGMSVDQSRIYNEMRRDLVTYFNSQACVATLAITKALRLMQITSGFISLEDANSLLPTATVQAHLKDTPKLQALEELLEQLTEDPKAKVLVWAVWRENYKQIREVCEKLKLKYVEVHGGISGPDRDKAVASLNNDPLTRVFISHPGSGGIGINLVAAGYSIFYSRTFSLEQYLQARARNHRGGSKEAGHKSITHYDLVCEGTIDEVVVKRLAQKEDMSDKLLSDILADVQAQVG